MSPPIKCKTDNGGPPNVENVSSTCECKNGGEI